MKVYIAKNLQEKKNQSEIFEELPINNQYENDGDEKSNADDDADDDTHVHWGLLEADQRFSWNIVWKDSNAIQPIYL